LPQGGFQFLRFEPRLCRVQQLDHPCHVPASRRYWDAATNTLL
jgi:hypothetical protein